MKKAFLKSLKLNSAELESINQKLESMIASNIAMPALAYAGYAKDYSNVYLACRGCDGSCKGSCSGGCTSW